MTDPGVARLLVVDDEPQLLRVLRPSLIAAGFQVATADDGRSALALLAGEGFDGVILDLGLPDMDGKTVIGRIREWSEVPIVVLSARDQEDEKIAALDLGADDFVNKPFGVGELLARVRAALRGRVMRLTATGRLRALDLDVDFAARRVFVLDQEIRVTVREFDLIRALARHAGRVLTHRQIITAVWGPDCEADSQSVRVLVGQVRSKIEANPSSPRIILTEPGVGYRLSTEPRRPQ
jgi:two-component system KDP operon response regulator KdpE